MSPLVGLFFTLVFIHVATSFEIIKQHAKDCVFVSSNNSNDNDIVDDIQFNSSDKCKIVSLSHNVVICEDGFFEVTSCSWRRVTEHSSSNNASVTCKGVCSGLTELLQTSYIFKEKEDGKIILPEHDSSSNFVAVLTPGT